MMLRDYFEYYEKQNMGQKPSTKQICRKLKDHSLDDFAFKFSISFLHTLELSKLHPVASCDMTGVPNNNDEDYSLQDVAILQVIQDKKAKHRWPVKRDHIHLFSSGELKKLCLYRNRGV